jgi:hypothetical protein
VGSAVGPTLAGSVQVQVGAFLEIALRAGMDLAEVVALTGPGVPTVAVPQQESATLAALEQVAPRALVQQAGAMMGLSPVARRAHAAMQPAAASTSSDKSTVRAQDTGTGAPLHVVQADQEAVGPVGTGSGQSTPGGPEASRLKGGKGRQPGTGGPTYREVTAEAVTIDPESSAMGAARGARRDLEAGDASVARQVERADAEAREEQVASISRDAELAMLLMAEEAQERVWIGKWFRGHKGGFAASGRRDRTKVRTRERASHRQGIQVKWRERLAGSASSAREPGVAHRTWLPSLCSQVHKKLRRAHTPTH